MKFFFLMLIKTYKLFISPFLMPACRFYPTCSEYAKQSFEEFPIHLALWYSSLRILKCNPLSKGGSDPVSKCKTCQRV